MKKRACPYCGQGLLHRITIRAIKVTSYICSECDTVWLRYEDISGSAGNFVEELFKWIGSKNLNYQAELEYHEICDWPAS
jgi:transposase-like protein